MRPDHQCAQNRSLIPWRSTPRDKATGARSGAGGSYHRRSVPHAVDRDGGLRVAIYQGERLGAEVVNVGHQAAVVFARTFRRSTSRDGYQQPERRLRAIVELGRSVVAEAVSREDCCPWQVIGPPCSARAGAVIALRQEPDPSGTEVKYCCNCGRASVGRLHRHLALRRAGGLSTTSPAWASGYGGLRSHRIVFGVLADPASPPPKCLAGCAHFRQFAPGTRRIGRPCWWWRKSSRC